MIKVMIEDCGIKLPAEIKIEDNMLLVTPNEPLHKDEAGECEYIVSGWNDGKDSCIWVAIVKGNISISGGCLCYDTIAGLYLKTTAAITEKFWADKYCESASFMHIANAEERKKLDDALAEHGLVFDKQKSELVMKNEQWYCPAWNDSDCRFYSAVCEKGNELWYHKKGWLFAAKTGAQAKCDALNIAINNL